jgi:hypothetical protein
MSWSTLPPPPRPDHPAIPPRPDLRPGPTPKNRHLAVRGVALGLGVLLVLSGLGTLQDRGPAGGPGTRADAGSSEGPSFRFFARTAGGRPIRWNPCEPIGYQIDLGPLPQSAAADIHEAFAKMSQATGIEFTFEGYVTVDIFDRLADRDFVAPGPSGGIEWAPILVAWRPQQTLLDFGADRDVIGLGLPIVSRLDRGQFVSGVIVLNADAGLHGGFATGFDRGPLVLHELGHVIGLGHVSDRSQLMFRRSVGWVTGFGDGDLMGLERLGVDAGCLVTPTAELDAALVPPGLGHRRPRALP